ncbi:MAG: integrase core domain-containing protein [Gemmatimonadales bacterium]
MALVRAVRRRFGVSLALGLLGLARATWYYQRRRQPYAEQHRHLRRPLEAIARAHPEYGYRRATVELRQTHGWWVNHKVVQRLHKLWALPLLRSTRRPRPSGVRQVLAAVGARANLVAGRRRIRPFAVLYTDFTALRYARGTAHLLVLLDHATKLVLGWAVGPAVTALALAAWTMAKRTLARFRRRAAGVIVHHDQDPVFTSYGWTAQLLLRDRARVSYALRGAKDNPQMEAFNSRFKNENRSLFLDAEDPEQLRGVVAERMAYYNRERRHSALGQQSPLSYARQLTPRG